MKGALRIRSRGQSLVEFALVFPLLVLLMLALVDIGRAVFTYNAITNAARETARLAIVNQFPAAISSRARGQSAGLAATVTATYHRQSPNANPETNPECSPVAVGCVAVVTIQVPYSPITPVASTFVGSITFTAKSVVPVEFVCPNDAIPAFATEDKCPKRP